MIYITIFIALVLSIYINRSLQRRRELKKGAMRERGEEYLWKLFEQKKKAGGGTIDEVSD
jgi:hypothetical protein